MACSCGRILANCTVCFPTTGFALSSEESARVDAWLVEHGEELARVLALREGRS